MNKNTLIHSALQKSFKRSMIVLPLMATVPFLSSAEEIEQADTKKASLEVITVTSRKMPESLQDAPVAVTAFTSDMLEKKGMDDLTNVADVTPSVKIVSEGGISGGSAAANVFVRGVGQADFLISGDPGVGIYIDGVYYARTIGAAMDLVDLDQVEILRGPQGTLFGRNTIGGAINLTSKRPEFDDFYGKVSVGLGQEGYKSFSGSVNLPIAENLAARVSVMRRQRDGFVKALQYDDVDLGNEDMSSARARIIWQANEDLELDFNVDYSKDNTYGSGSVATDYNTDAAFVAGANRFTGGDCTTTVGQATNSACIGPVQLTDDNYSTNNVWFDLEGNKIKPFSLFENYGASLTATWIINDDLEFKSITAYRELDAQFIRAWGHGPSLVFQNTTDAYTSEQFSQEFQLNGTSLGGNLRWVSGLYFFTEDGFESDTVALATPPGFGVSARPDDEFTVENKTIAVFGQGTYNLNEDLHLTLGLRYTKEEKTGGSEATVSSGERVFFGIEPIETSNVTPYISLSYDLDEYSMTYASFSQGFKSGTFSTRTPDPDYYLNADGTAQNLPTAKQEEVDAFEIGLKSELFEGTLRSNIALFRSEYTDIQVSAPDNVNTIFVNGGDAVLQGFEAELTYLVTEELILSTAIGLMDAEYTKINPGIPLYEDTEIYGTPDYTVSIGAEYTFRIGEADLTANLDWNFVDDQVLDSQSTFPEPAGLVKNEHIYEDGYNFGNLSLVYIPDHDEWSVSLHVNNLSDAEYRVGAQDKTSDKISAPFGVTSSHYNRPREVQARFNYNF